MEKYVKSFVLFLGLFSFAMSQAQDRTRATQFMHFSSSEEQILVVPFEPRMLISDIHPPMCKQNDLGPEDMISTLQGVIVEQLVAQAGFHIQAEDNFHDSEFHGRMRYKYLPAPEIPCMISQKEKPWQKKKRKGEEKNLPALYGGEVRTISSAHKKYMKPVIEAEVVKEIASDQGVDHILILTEIDFKIDHSKSIDPRRGSFKDINLHFAIFSAEGMEEMSGMVTRTTEDRNYQLGHLIQEYIGPMCEEIVTCFGMLRLNIREKEVQAEKESEAKVSTQNDEDEETKKFSFQLNNDNNDEDF